MVWGHHAWAPVGAAMGSEAAVGAAGSTAVAAVGPAGSASEAAVVGPGVVRGGHAVAATSLAILASVLGSVAAVAAV